MAGNAIDAVADVVTRLRARAPHEVHDELETIARRLHEPLRIAVAGRVKAGKSTLVNALLGQRIAPTDVSECTRVVTWFRYGHPQRIEVETRSGLLPAQPLADGAVLPAELGAPVEDVVGVHVYLANQGLRTVTLIDTPGLGSVHPEFSASAAELLRVTASSRSAIHRADAVVYLINQVVLEDELTVLTSLADADADAATDEDPVRVLGVLGRADQLGDGSTDPWPVAVELAGHYADLLHDRLSSVLPVMGLLAETAQTAALTERDAQAVADLAALPPAELTKLTWTADRFCTAHSPVPADRRVRLLALLGLRGVSFAVDLVRAGVTGAGALRRALADRSGIQAVDDALRSLVGERDAVLRARSALAALRRLAYRPELGPAAAELRDDLDMLHTSAALQPIAELEAWQDVTSGAAPLPEALRADLRALVTADGMAARPDPDAIRAALIRWRQFLNGEATPAQQAVARTVLRSYQHQWARR